MFSPDGSAAVVRYQYVGKGSGKSQGSFGRVAKPSGTLCVELPEQS